MKTKQTIRVFKVIVLTITIGFTFAACTSITTTPHFYTFSGSENFEVLGEVIYESADRIGYIELLRAARRLYPECEYVIDIMIDRRNVTTQYPLLPFKPTIRTTWVMRGTAIKYTGN